MTTQKPKTPCTAGQPHAWVLAPRKQGTTLVDCPHCARTNLSSTSASNLVFCDALGCHEGREYGLVPPHTEVPLDATKIPAAEFGDDPDSWEVDYDLRYGRT
jgi:hypothetical protein